LSALVGFGVKGYLYASAVHNVAAAGEAAELARLETSWPLLALAALLLAGRLVRRFWERRTHA
ncbi:MAG: rhodanese, partial [Thermodesulfobacteriota bacterium]